MNTEFFDGYIAFIYAAVNIREHLTTGVKVVSDI